MHDEVILDAAHWSAASESDTSLHEQIVEQAADELDRLLDLRHRGSMSSNPDP